jgi:hypothetical protein
MLGQRGDPPQIKDGWCNKAMRGQGWNTSGGFDRPVGVCSSLVRQCRSIRRNYCSIVTLSVSNLERRYLESNLSLRSEKPTSNRLLNGAVWLVIHHCISDETGVRNLTLLSHGVSAFKVFQRCSGGGGTNCLTGNGRILMLLWLVIAFLVQVFELRNCRRESIRVWREVRVWSEESEESMNICQ